MILAVKRFFEAGLVKMKNGSKKPENRLDIEHSGDPVSPAPTADRPAEPVVISSELLLAGRTEIQIRHRGDIYRLTLTKAGKLILHK